jgi:hypothetical protein
MKQRACKGGMKWGKKPITYAMMTSTLNVKQPPKSSTVVPFPTLHSLEYGKRVLEAQAHVWNLLPMSK